MLMHVTWRNQFTWWLCGQLRKAVQNLNSLLVNQVVYPIVILKIKQA